MLYPRHDQSGTAIYADQLGWFGGSFKHIWRSHGMSGIYIYIIHMPEQSPDSAPPQIHLVTGSLEK